jgi:hypothetical protein
LPLIVLIDLKILSSKAADMSPVSICNVYWERDE